MVSHPLGRNGIWLTMAWVSLLAYCFANVEVQIEGASGWAAALPTWRIEHHWLLDVFWGGRPMTGYHAWMFPFIVLVFHFPAFLFGRWSWRMEARVLACVMQFWIMEDFLWFVLNPSFGLVRFTPIDVPWQKHWWWGVPSDYWTFSAVALFLFWWSTTAPRASQATIASDSN